MMHVTHDASEKFDGLHSQTIYRGACSLTIPSRRLIALTHFITASLLYGYDDQLRNQ